MGMSMTEKQGGSDVRSNTTIASPIDSNTTGLGAPYLLVGHKWFTSAPMCDGFLTLAKTPGNDLVSCFLVPRWLPENAGNERNTGFRVMRLKNKVADRSNASSEVEYHNAYGVMVGEEGKGVKTIIEMVQATRWDCTLGSAGTGRKAVQIALNHAVC
jgi:putative acyl-CoA dehydrogenase